MRPGLAVVAERELVGGARGNGDDVLEGPAQLNPGHVPVAIDPERAGADHLTGAHPHLFVLRSHNRGCRQTVGDLDRQVGTGHCRDAVAGGGDLFRQDLGHAHQRALLDALGDRQQDGIRCEVVARR